MEGKEPIQLSTLASEVIHTLLYFDIFKHPLKKTEVLRFLRIKFTDDEELDQTLKLLVGQKLIHQQEVYFGFEDLDFKVQRRIEAEKKANEVKGIALFFSKLIYQFPFSKGVAISGSLSKGCMYEDGDVDFFIITSKNRLWINRVLLTVFKKVFLLNSKKYCCINYFIAEDSLEIPNPNYFIAVETATLLPQYGLKTLQLFFDANPWLYDYFPNLEAKTLNNQSRSKNYITRAFEKALKSEWGNRLDNQFLLLMQKVKRVKSRASDDTSFQSDKNVSKHHPENRQSMVPELMAKNVKTFELKHTVTLNFSKDLLVS